jgi:predicted nucleic acid-binding protein
VSVVIDASVLVGIAAAEAGSDAARALMEREDAVAPELVLAEAANALWRKVRLGMMSAEQARHAVHGLPRLFAELTPLAALAPAALALALRRDHPVYDCFYVALAMREGAPLLTADRRLAERLAADAEIRLLG